MTTMTVRVSARANIALAKYWGKADAFDNLPAVPSLSLTLEGLVTTTSVRFDQALSADRAWLDGQAVSGRPLERIVAMLDRVRTMVGVRTFASIESRNDFPTAAGLASSASGFAALALAATRAVGLDLSPQEVSALARRSSASAARSVFGGYVALQAGAEWAEPIAPSEHLPLVMLVVTTTQGAKKVGSTDGMRHTAQTSPYYSAWVKNAPYVYEEIRRAVLDKDVERLGWAAEHSALAMHASMWAARPAIRYFAPSTLTVLDRVQALREGGAVVFATMDAGPHVKVITTPADADRVEGALRELSAASSVLRCVGGEGPSVQIIKEAENAGICSR
jgi:diphosphomevalonate decarboxylase